MKGQALMLITDISGYTRYFTQAGHEKGVQRAQDLLQIIINANSLGLKLCEVEGDAVFFYVMKRLPSRKALMDQVNKTYEAFNHYLSVNNLDSELGIKFFIHTGVCEELRIGGRTKLYGTEVIKIHRLLKSITNKDDYMLITEEAGATFGFQPMEGTHGTSEFPHIGAVHYALYSEHFLQGPEPRSTFLTRTLDALGEAAWVLSRGFARHSSAA